VNVWSSSNRLTALKARASAGVAALLPHLQEPGYGLKMAKEWGINPTTVAGWFKSRHLSTGHLFGTPEGVARNNRKGKKAEARRVQEEKRAKWSGKCGVTGKPCDESKTCIYGGEALSADTGCSQETFSKLDACAYGVKHGVDECRRCRKKAVCDETWTCWKKDPEVRRMREELVYAPQRRRDRRDGRSFIRSKGI